MRSKVGNNPAHCNVEVNQIQKQVSYSYAMKLSHATLFTYITSKIGEDDFNDE
jgi:hypothetical protein